MIIEFAEIEVKPGMEKEFIEGVEKSRPIFARAPGCHGLVLKQCIETPERFILKVKWETLEHHTVQFVNSRDFNAWRAFVGHCFAGKPRVYHTQNLVEDFKDDTETAGGFLLWGKLG
jgi:heme-degrading monooxygenase HmoA